MIIRPDALVLDHTALSAFQQCPAKFELQVLQGYVPKRLSSALRFGKAYHAGVAELYRTDWDKEMAEQACVAAWGSVESDPVEGHADHRTLSRCISTVNQYADRYQYDTFNVVRDADGVPMIELTFTLDTGLVVGDRRVLYGGNFDGLLEANGFVYVMEHKTARSVGMYYWDMFKPSNQLTGYVWAASRLLPGARVMGAVVRAVAILKTTNTFDQRLITFDDADLGEWLKDVEACAKLIVDCYERGYFPRNTTACTLYGRCTYYDVHIAHPDTRQKILDTDYDISPWDHERRAVASKDA